MLEGFNPIRYSVIEQKNKREIVMLRGGGCKWMKCRFCDYHLDNDQDPELNFSLNKEVLSNVTGIYQKLEVINSGSFGDLDSKTMELIKQIVIDKKIKEVHFECHFLFRKDIKPLREEYAKLGVSVIVKLGIETFDYLFRESYLDKGIACSDISYIASYFDECCLLLGLPGQTKESMLFDIETGLKYFSRVCVNIMQENGMPVKPDPKVIDIFIKEILPIYEDDYRVDILLENNAFGVGGVTTEGEVK